MRHEPRWKEPVGGLADAGDGESPVPSSPTDPRRPVARPSGAVGSPAALPSTPQGRGCSAGVIHGPAHPRAAAVDRRSSRSCGGKRDTEGLEVTDTLAPQAHRAGTHCHSRGLPTFVAQSEHISMGFAGEHMRRHQKGTSRWRYAVRLVPPRLAKREGTGSSAT
jgi:hypothetical protein